MEGDLQRTLGERVRTIRAERGLSQEALGDLIGYHRTFIGGVERGERNLSLRTLERLAASLEVHPLDLLTPARPALRAAGDGRRPSDARTHRARRRPGPHSD